MIDPEIFDAGFKSICDFGDDDLMPHFIYCGYHYLSTVELAEKLKEIILRKMRKYGIQSSILTVLWMTRWNLVTKEKVKKAAEGKLKDDEDWKHYKGSINDDLERFFINLQDENEIKEEGVSSFFAPKLTNEEMKLVQERNQEHLNTYSRHIAGLNPDVDVEEMKQSNSKSKFVHGGCVRCTIPLTLDTIQTEDITKDELQDAKITIRGTQF